MAAKLQKWSGNPVSYAHLRIVGYPAYFPVNGGKLEPRARKCIFLGYENVVKGYRLWWANPKSPGFVTSRDVTFDKNSMPHPRKEFVVDTTSSVE